VRFTKTLVLPLAGLLIVGAAGAVMATSSSTPSSGTDTTVVPAAESASPAPSAATTAEPKDTVLSDVLDDLVTKGTIDSSQRTAILDAVTAERTARREARQAAREQLKSFLADGQITQAELDQLPADSPLRTLTSLMDDGKITTDELRTLGRGFLGRGHGFGKGGIFGTPDATPSPSTGTSG
jgi:polyhydroxyalkanoate synthesis regulator phasin